MKKIGMALSILLLIPAFILAQEHGVEHPEDAEHSEHHEHNDIHEVPMHRIGFGGGYTYVPDGSEESGGSKGVFVPTLSLEYFYKFTHDWSAGLMLDLELSNYLIPFASDILNRDKVLVIGLVSLYEFTHGWSFFYGGGIEIEHHKNFAVFKLGLAYEYSFSHEWDVSPALAFDYKGEYSSLALLITFGKRF